MPGPLMSKLPGNSRTTTLALPQSHLQYNSQCVMYLFFLGIQQILSTLSRCQYLLIADTILHLLQMILMEMSVQGHKQNFRFFKIVSKLHHVSILQ